MGEPAGHPFRGNQWTDSKTGGFSFPPTEEHGEEQLSESEVRDMMKSEGKDMGRAEVARAAGALPGSRVIIGSGMEPGIALSVHIEFMGEDGFPIGRATRHITEQNTIYNHELEFDAGFKGKGLGLKVFSSQVDEAAKHGFDAIEAQCAGGPRSADWQNGYYTWARFGYDGVIPNGYGPRGERTVQEVMQSPSGPAWWKANGEAFDGTFLLAEGSTSRRVFDEYRRLRGVR